MKRKASKEKKIGNISKKINNASGSKIKNIINKPKLGTLLINLPIRRVSLRVQNMKLSKLLLISEGPLPLEIKHNKPCKNKVDDLKLYIPRRVSLRIKNIEIAKILNNSLMKTQQNKTKQIKKIAKTQPKNIVKRESQKSLKIQPKKTSEIQLKQTLEIQSKTTLKMQPKKSLKMQPKANLSTQPKRTVKLQPKQTLEIQPKKKVAMKTKQTLKIQPKKTLKQVTSEKTSVVSFKMETRSKKVLKNPTNETFTKYSGNPLPEIKESNVCHIINFIMAVKKHGLVTNNNKQLDLQALAQYIQLMNEQPGYLPSTAELVKNCQGIVKCLARSPGNEDDRWVILQSLEEFLLRIVNTVDDEARTAIVTGVIDKFYSYISDPQSDADVATSIVLVVLDTSRMESLMSTTRWVVQQGENGPAGAGLRASLSCLYSWLSVNLVQWQGTPVLGYWVMSFIKALEENERFDILIEVSVDNIDRLFSVMDMPSTLRQPNADVILHVLASLRQSPDAFDKISHHVGRVLTNLASDSGQFSRQLLQNIVDILTTTVDHLVKKARGGAKAAFKEKYGEVILCLERHMASRGCQQLNTAPWPARKACAPRELVACNLPEPADRKVGLLNLGNTCYMNSVMQALLVTRRFSTHVMMRMTGHPYWAIAAMLFGKLVHSVSTKLDSHDFFETMRPPFFTSNNQHDSSEFLGYLFELLQSFEHMSDENYDYSKPPVLSTANRWRAATQSYTAPSSDGEAAGSGSNRRSVSPRPGGSGGGSSSSGQKRAGSDQESPLPKKRTRSNELAFLRRDSYIDSVFGGVLLTRLECVQCHSTSLSRDVFRDLQLAFPEKPVGGQHNVQSLLEFYCSKERLTGDNQYQCRDCGVRRDAERSVIIENIPKYLILVLKNFKFESKLQTQSKLIHNMYYNPTITLPAVRAQITHGSYTLYAAVVHSGSTLDSGHYYTIAKDNGAWHKYNDDEVTEADESQINQLEKFSTPYLLFYRRDDVEEDTAPALNDLPPKILEHVLAHNKHYVDSLRP